MNKDFIDNEMEKKDVLVKTSKNQKLFREKRWKQEKEYIILQEI